MFKLKPNPTFIVEVDIPRADGEDGKLKVKYKHKGKDGLQAFLESLGKDGDTRKDVDVLLDIMDGWDEVDAPFGEKSLTAMLNDFPAASKAIFDAYLPALMDGVRKN